MLRGTQTLIIPPVPPRAACAEMEIDVDDIPTPSTGPPASPRVLPPAGLKLLRREGTAGSTTSLTELTSTCLGSERTLETTSSEVEEDLLCGGDIVRCSGGDVGCEATGSCLRGGNHAFRIRPCGCPICAECFEKRLPTEPLAPLRKTETGNQKIQRLFKSRCCPACAARENPKNEERSRGHQPGWGVRGRAGWGPGEEVEVLEGPRPAEAVPYEPGETYFFLDAPYRGGRDLKPCLDGRIDWSEDDLQALRAQGEFFHVLDVQ